MAPGHNGRRSIAAAFQFYPQDWLASRKVRSMTLEERGAYITLLAEAWLEGGSLADDPAEIADALGVEPEEAERMLAGRLGRCFQRVDGRLVNARMARELERMEEYREAKAAAGRKSGKARRERAEADSTNTRRTETNTCSDSFEQTGTNANPLPSPPLPIPPQHSSTRAPARPEPASPADPPPAVAAAAEDFPEGDQSEGGSKAHPLNRALDAIAALPPAEPASGAAEVFRPYGVTDPELLDAWGLECSDRNLDPVQTARAAVALVAQEAPRNAGGWLSEGIRSGWLADRVSSPQVATERPESRLVADESARKNRELQRQQATRAEAERRWREEKEAGEVSSFTEMLKARGLPVGDQGEGEPGVNGEEVSA